MLSIDTIRQLATRPVLVSALWCTPLLGTCTWQPGTTAVSATTAETGRPAAVTEAIEHDCGWQDWAGHGAQEFHVQNTGTAPLKLSTALAADPSLAVELLPPELAPGASGKVRLTWQVGRQGPTFERTATVRTNDPFRATIEFSVTGKVRMPLMAETVNVGDVLPGRAGTAEITVASQRWSAFAIDEVICSWKEAAWTIEPAAPERLKTLDAKAGYRVVLTTPTDLPRGPFQGTLTIRASPRGEPRADDHQAEPLAVDLRGRVLRRLALYGEAVQEDGTLDLGHSKLGQGLRHRLLIRVRDPEPELKIAALRVTPDFLKVSVRPVPSDDTGGALYHLEIEIPPDAPRCEYRGIRFGEIHLDVDHPRLEDLDLKAFFSVRPAR